MFGLSEILALAIGLFFVYLLLSAITSYITEAISNKLRLRSKNLADAIQMLFEPSTSQFNGYQRLKESWTAEKEQNTKLKANFLKAFYEHPIIRSLSRPNQQPSYIAARDFSITLLDLLMDTRQSRPQTLEQYPAELSPAELFLAEVKNNINCLNEDMQRTLLSLIAYAEVIEVDPDKRMAQVRQNIEHWYETTIDRASGWYKNRVQIIGIVVGFLVASVLNADTINIVHSLWTDTAMRQGLVQTAQKYSEQNVIVNYTDIMNKLNVVKFPMGWSPDHYKSLAIPSVVLSKIIGLLITALAISVGSTIWFDILNRVINLRSTGDKPQPSPL